MRWTRRADEKRVEWIAGMNTPPVEAFGETLRRDRLAAGLTKDEPAERERRQ